MTSWLVIGNFKLIPWAWFYVKLFVCYLFLLCTPGYYYTIQIHRHTTQDTGEGYCLYCIIAFTQTLSQTLSSHGDGARGLRGVVDVDSHTVRCHTTPAQSPQCLFSFYRYTSLQDSLGLGSLDPGRQDLELDTISVCVALVLCQLGWLLASCVN